MSGIQRFAYELVRSLDSLLSSGRVIDQGMQVELLVPRNASLEVPLNRIKLKRVGRLTGHAWEQLELPVYSKGNLLFTPSGGAPVIHDQHVMIMADAAVFAASEGYSWRYSLWYRWLFRRMGKKARDILTISKFSEHELQTWCLIPSDKITVTSAGCEHILRSAPDLSILDKHGLGQKPFVLAVGSLNPNKNLKGIAEAIRLMHSQPLTFALAGGVNASVFSHHTLPGNVVRLGFVTDAQLRALYENALCFVFPSFYEGFGIPPLEAMTCGCPVVVGRAASLPEVCGEAALYCDPMRPADIAAKIRQFAENPAMRVQFIERGKIHAQRFTWERVAEDTWSVLKRVIGESSL